VSIIGPLKDGCYKFQVRHPRCVSVINRIYRILQANTAFKGFNVFICNSIQCIVYNFICNSIQCIVYNFIYNSIQCIVYNFIYNSIHCIVYNFIYNSIHYCIQFFIQFYTLYCIQFYIQFYTMYCIQFYIQLTKSPTSVLYKNLYRSQPEDDFMQKAETCRCYYF
jgi:hypothetical protein